MITFWIILYLFMLLVITQFVSRKYRKDPNYYAMAGRKVNGFGVFSSIFTLIGAGEFLTIASLAFINSGASVALMGGYTLGLVILGLFAKKARKEAENKAYLSLPDYMYDKYGRFTGLLSNLMTICTFFSLLVLQLFSGAVLLNFSIGIPMWGGIIICSCVVGLYVWSSGLGGVIVTDVIQFLFMAIGMPFLAFIALKNPQDAIKVLDLDFSIVATGSVLATGMFAVIGSGDIWQRLYAAKSDISARIGFIGASLGVTIYGVLIALVGIAAHENGLTSVPDEAFISVILAHPNDVVRTIVVLTVFSAVLSTADTEIYLISSLIANERRRWARIKYDLTKEVPAKMIRSFIPVVSFFAILAAIYASSVVSIYQVLLLIMLALSPVVIMTPWRKLSPMHSAITIFIGIITLIFVISAPNMIPIDFAVVMVVPGLIYSLIFSKARN